MKLIKAIFKPFKLDDVRVGLEAADVHGMTVSDCRGMGRQKGHEEIYRGSEYVVGLLPKSMIELVVPDHMGDGVIDVIATHASTGRIGDGKIFVMPVEQAVRIRTGATGPDAL